MAATVSLRVYTDENLSLRSGPVTSIDLISADNNDSSEQNRSENPLTPNSKSYEKWVKARIDVAPDNNVSNFQAWGDGTVQSSTTLYVGIENDQGDGDLWPGITPTNSNSSVATNDFIGYTNTSKLSWHSTAMTDVDDMTDFLVFQLDVDSDADVGNWTQEVMSWSYDET